MNPYTISPISDGQYHVRIYLDEWLPRTRILEFKKRYDDICREDSDFKNVSYLDGHILQYRSESLFPFPTLETIASPKKKVMIIFGNPASHSVANGMFFFSKKNDNRHQFWGKLENAGLIDNKTINCTSISKIEKRRTEAHERKELIEKGDFSSYYLIGLTTFYSFPTPVRPDKKQKNPIKYDYGDAQGVERLFEHCLDNLQKMEFDRLNSYDFAKNASWIFTQYSSYLYTKGFNRIDYWPLRGAGSSGNNLKKILLDP